MALALDHRNYYRLPWNYADNGISWLEPTTKCNLRCEGCYRDTDSDTHKTLEQVRSDLEVFKRLRKSDCISIAGGDPLVHPQIVDIVRMVREMGWKPIINTNGVALTESLLVSLKQAGVYGFTFHIDTSQNRPRLKGVRSESELNGERLRYARMLAAAGDLSCSFNATITDKTLGDVPNLVRWAQKHADIVHTMVFILYRSPELTGDFQNFVGGEPVGFEQTYKETSWGGDRTINAPDVVTKIREADPLYEPAAYLNGTAKPDSFKWLLATRLTQGGETIGYVSPRFMELVQTFKHLLTGRYLAYTKPSVSARGRSTTLLTAFVDKRMRGLLWRLLVRAVRTPKSAFRPAHMQSIMIIQPINIEADGSQDMCDGCPDMTVHNGKLVWSCRLEELNRYGTFVTTLPRERAVV